MTALSRTITRHRVGLALTTVFLALVLFGYGAWRLLSYSLPMYQEDFPAAAEYKNGNVALALYDAGLQAFKDGDFDGAQELLTKAYSAMTEEKQSLTQAALGVDHKLAAQVQFLLAVTLERKKQKFMAIEAYQQALRHDPSHMEAKYNLERLLMARGGQGAGEGDGKGDGQGKPGDKTGSGRSQEGRKGI